MRVCMIVYSLYDCDNRVRRYSEALTENGDHVDVISLSSIKDETQKSNKSTHMKVLEKVNVYEIQKRTYDEKSKFTYLFRITKFLFRAAVLITNFT